MLISHSSSPEEEKGMKFVRFEQQNEFNNFKNRFKCNSFIILLFKIIG